MAILARFLAFALVLTMASALDQWGLFCCPDFKSEAVGIPYNDPAALAAYYLVLSFRGPYKVIAAAESLDAAAYSCVKLTPTGLNYAIEYKKNGTVGTASMDVDIISRIFKGTLPQGLLGVPDSTTERTWTIVSDKNGYIVMKTCKGALFSHFTSTYILVDNGVDTANLDMTTLTPLLNQANLPAVNKICPP